MLCEQLLSSIALVDNNEKIFGPVQNRPFPANTLDEVKGMKLIETEG